MSNNMIKLTESQLKKIVNESVKSVLNESFTDNRIAQAIKEHGGLSKFQNKFGAKINADYDLQTAAYKGYLSRETVNEIEAAVAAAEAETEGTNPPLKERVTELSELVPLSGQ